MALNDPFLTTKSVLGLAERVKLPPPPQIIWLVKETDSLAVYCGNPEDVIDWFYSNESIGYNQNGGYAYPWVCAIDESGYDSPDLLYASGIGFAILINGNTQSYVTVHGFFMNANAIGRFGTNAMYKFSGRIDTSKRDLSCSIL